MLALRHAQKIKLDTQLQTTVTRRNMARLPEVAKIAEEIGTRMWSLFFLIVTGRALENDDLAAEQYEQVFEFMYNLSKTAPFGIKTTEAMHYRRYVAQRMRTEHGGAGESEGAKQVAFRTAGVSDGKGFVFVSHTGEIFPSGFLPITAGNVLRDSLTDVYRNSDLFKKLRDTGAREGKCGICEYQKICGGSRSRAYALTGDYMASDPRCVYQPHLADAIC
jgi:radical SAM protein with 4Fe4S-binding SPASM domain